MKPSRPRKLAPLPAPRPMVIVQGRGTPRERRVTTSILLYPVRRGTGFEWVTIPS